MVILSKLLFLLQELLAYCATPPPLQLGNHVKYISFNTNLSTRTKTIEKSPDCFWSYLSLIILGLLHCECPDFSLLVFIISLLNINYSSVVNLTLKFSKILSRVIFSITSIYIYSMALPR